MSELRIFFFLFLKLNFIQAQTTIILHPNATKGKDATITSLSPNLNYGTDPDFAAISWTNGGISFNERGLINFDLSSIPQNSVISNATLSLYSNPNSSNTQLSTGANASYLQRITSTWDENTVTWNNQPSTTLSNQILLPQSTSQTQDYPNIDVKQLILDMLADTAHSFGFMLRLQTEATYRTLLFASSDHPDSTKWPKLVITFTVPVMNKLFCNRTILCDGDLCKIWASNATSAGYYISSKRNGTDTTQLTNDTLLMNHLVTSPKTFYLYESGILTDSVTITYISPNIKILPHDTFFCSGNFIFLNTNISNAQILWSTGDTTSSIKVNQEGMYWVKIYSGSCIVADTAAVRRKQTPIIFLGNDTTLCSGNTVTLKTNYPNAKYLWNDNSVADSFTVNKAGKYFVAVTDSGCISSDTININYLFPPTVFLGNDTTLCDGETIILNAGNSGSTYMWSNQTTQSNLMVKDSGTYFVKVINACGSDTGSINVSFKLCSTELFFPNAFTPDGNGLNDFYLPKGFATDYSIAIYNRWGMKLFETNNLAIGWDGTFGNIECPDGVYFYLSSYKDRNHSSHKVSGTIELLR